jgi:formate/nitrite transporter FocA (FNT family)
MSALTAGLEIGFSILLMGVLYTVFSPHFSEKILHLIYSFGYPLGFLFVILGRSQLFTEQTALAIMPVLNGKVGLGELLRLWSVVFIANVIGGAIFAVFISWIGPHRGIISPEAFITFADNLIEPNWYVILGSATLAGWMMGLLGWLVSSAQETISRMLVVVFITLIIGFGSLHHCIVGSVELVCGMFIEKSPDLAKYGMTMLFSVLGNIIGGAFFVGVLKYSTVKT